MINGVIERFLQQLHTPSCPSMMDGDTYRIVYVYKIDIFPRCCMLCIAIKTVLCIKSFVICNDLLYHYRLHQRKHNPFLLGWMWAHIKSVRSARLMVVRDAMFCNQTCLMCPFTHDGFRHIMVLELRAKNKQPIYIFQN